MKKKLHWKTTGIIGTAGSGAFGGGPEDAFAGEGEGRCEVGGGDVGEDEGEDEGEGEGVGEDAGCDVSDADEGVPGDVDGAGLSSLLTVATERGGSKGSVVVICTTEAVLIPSCCNAVSICGLYVCMKFGSFSESVGTITHVTKRGRYFVIHQWIYEGYM